MADSWAAGLLSARGRAVTGLSVHWQVLNTLKHKLNTLTTESEWLKRETVSRKEALAKIVDEIGVYKADLAQAKQANFTQTAMLGYALTRIVE